MVHPTALDVILLDGGTCYVPLIRSDTTGPYAKVGVPYSPTSPYRLVPEIEEVISQDQHQPVQNSPLRASPVMLGRRDMAPVAPAVGISSPTRSASHDLRDFRNMRVWAYAGPMSPQEAEEFRREWKCPSKGKNPRENFKITDGERGFERFGRTLAEKHRTSWQEYWPFLDAFADLRSVEGLAKMENFFLRQRVLLLMQTMAAWKKVRGQKRKTVPQEKSQGKESEEDVKNVGSEKFDMRTLAGSNQDEASTEQERPPNDIDQPSDEGNYFVPSSSFSVGPQYVLSPDPHDAENVLDAFGSPQSASDEDKYFSAESSSDSEEENENVKKDNQRKQSDSSNSEVAAGPGFLGTFWQGLSRLREYLSPRKSSPASSHNLSDSIRSDDRDSSSNDHCHTPATGDNLKSERNESGADKPLSSIGSSETETKSVLSPLLVTSEGKDMPQQSVISSQILASETFESDKNSTTSVSCTAVTQKSESTSNIQSLSGSHSFSTLESKKTSHSKTEESEPTHKFLASASQDQNDLSASSQWQYRNSQDNVLSPEQSPDRHGNYLLEDGNCPEEPPCSCENLVSPGIDQVGSVSDASQQQQEPGDSSSKPALDDSFSTKLDSLCLSLSKFSFQSPSAQSSEAALPEHSDSLIDNSFIGNRSEMTKEPSIHLFVGKMYSRFLSDISSQTNSRKRQLLCRDDENEVSFEESHLPTLILRQEQDGETVVADVFLPCLTESKNFATSSALDLDTPVMLEEVHRDAIRGVWVNFVVAFSNTSEAREMCRIDEPVMAKTVITGVSCDTDTSWTYSVDSSTQKDIQNLFLKCKEEEFASTESSTVLMRAVRASSLPSRDLYICGSTPTKVDADVYHTMTASSKDLIRKEESGLALTCLWLSQMESRGADGIDSLPSPSRVLRSSRRVPPPISPLVKGETPTSVKTISGNKSIQHTPVLTGHQSRQPGRRVDALQAKKLFQQPSSEI
ncbi:ankyrin repeat and lem domain-containing protein 2 [Plakobranchus ocellatus]|uniref:Ankyrin repeat and lem domain-containing protein 2 n=1 Tax=Plakobranchus ocellatus TaxID=259542 RepID=A0AAV3YI91_9GAST|nr:ankyrin repeat and lem domain-containing protein 2 [Plakobranchus ocellatus]